MTCTPPKTLILRWLLDAILIPISTHWQVIQINISPLVCKTEYKPPADVLACEGDVKVIDSALRCVYDVDAYGYVLGCRSKSHLENCDTFECPPNTVKCPGTYCIPLKFVCDGELQCPGGEDEKDCGCKSELHEVIIVVDYNFLTNGDLSVEGFATQLGNHESIIRILSYEADQPLQNYDIGSHRLIIEDISLELRGFENTKEKCKYNIISEQFLSQVRFSDKKIKSVIFLESDSTAAVVANEIFSNNHSTFESDLLLYRVNEDPNAKRHVTDKYQHVTDIYIPRWKTLTDIGADFFPKLCGVSSKVYCPGKYKCAASRMCISLDNLCDGIKHCIHGDDERLCDFKCPVNCTCIGFAVSCHNKGLQIDMIKHISKNTRSLDLSKNSALGIILQASYLDIEGLVRLNLSQCNVEYIMPIVFDKINNIKILDLSSNLIRTISSGTFSGLKLEIVYLFNNDFISIEDFAFNGMSVEIIDFEPSSVSEFNKNIFTGVRNVKELRTPAFKFCCVRPNYLPEENCYPNKDEFSSCEDLMRLSALQTMLWLVGFSAFFGNILSVLYRLKYDRNRLKLGFGIFVTNLAVADFAMGVYLIIIAVADAVFRKRYIFNEDYWRNSVWCNLAGVLSTLSSEASVLFLCLITLDRLLVIKFPFGNVKFNSKKAIICACFVWLFALTIALVPILYGSYFQNKFYTKSGICIALPFTRDRPPGWLYSVALFVGFNFATFLLVAFGQWSIFMEIRKSSIRTKKPQAARKRDLVVARNLLLVVTTDFLCWFPIGVMGIMALNDHVIPADVYAWTAVFILPVNSALNPVLYTLTAILGKTTFNPSTDEQNRTELTKDFGNYFMNCHQLVNRYMSTRVMPRQKYRSVSSILDAEIHVPVHTLLQISSKIFKFLDVIQNGAMVLGTLNKQSVYLSVCHRQVTGSIRIQGKPSMSRNPADENDIRDAAVIIHNLLRNIDKKTITVE